MPPLLYGCDLETRLISEDAIAPKPICLTVSANAQTAMGVGNGDPEFLPTIEALFEPHAQTVWTNAKYDLLCICKRYPHLIPAVFAALADGRVHDTQILEKLGNLQEHGNLKAWRGGRLGYSQADMAKRHLDVDRYADKASSIRTSYEHLDGMPFLSYEPEFAGYALQDPIDCLGIYLKQRERWGEFPTETFQTCVDFALFWFTDRGLQLDHEEYRKLREMVDRESDIKNFPLLTDTGILRRPKPLRPYKVRWKRAREYFAHADDRDYEETALEEWELEEWIASGEKVAKFVPESRDMGVLRHEIARACRELGVDLQRTEGTENSAPAIATHAEFLMDLDDDPVIAQYRKREELSKLRTTELPRMCKLPERTEPAEVVRAPFDVLKETGRTSSGSDKLFPSFNGQNVDPRARGCYVARPGHVLCSVDFGAMELVTLAQTCLNLFGYSTLATVINQGIDPHAYLGTQLALAMAPGFSAEIGGLTGREAYAAFMERKETDFKFWKHWRTFAKPTGLGFPGGLGAKTFVKYAKGTFGVKTNIAEAQRLKEVWLDTYPEMRSYFDYVNNVLAEGPDTYRYTSPLGMTRAGATYCAACNGLGLQTPGAEGAKLAAWEVTRASYDISAGNGLLFGACFPVLFIHDEIVSEIPYDTLMHERAHEIGRIMVEAMGQVCPDVSIKAEPALMSRWDKRAEPVFENDKLTIWRPDDE